MSENIWKSEGGARTAYMKMGVWYDAKSDSIHVTVPGPGGFHSTVNAKPNPKSVRGHPNLFFKLARAMQEAGVPAPDIPDIYPDFGTKDQETLCSREVTKGPPGSR